MRHFLTALLLLVPSVPASGQSGLLLGLRADDGPPFAADPSRLRYRTLWFARSGDSVARVAELPTVIVPRDDGFWRLDFDPFCGITESTMEMTGPFVDEYADPVWRRFGSPRTFRPESGYVDCSEARKMVAAVSADSTEPQMTPEPCNVRDVNVTYASPRYVSLEKYTAHTEFCSPGRYASRTSLSVVDAVQQKPSLLRSLTPARRASLTRRWEGARTDCTFEETPEDNWGIVRGVGEWVTSFSSTGPTACRGDGMAEFDIRERVPASIARSEAPEWGARLRRLVAQLDDFFVSPAGDLVVTRSGDQLTFHASTRGVIGDPLFRYALRSSERVVLIEWATGRHVERWSRELSDRPVRFQR